MLIDRDGNILAQDQTRDDKIIYATFDWSPPKEERKAIATRHPEFYGPLVVPRAIEH